MCGCLIFGVLVVLLFAIVPVVFWPLLVVGLIVLAVIAAVIGLLKGVLGAVFGPR
jgi:hypothetical protein